MRRDQERVTEYKYVVRLPHDLGKALHDRASSEDRPISRIIRAALRDYLDDRRVQPAR